MNRIVTHMKAGTKGIMISEQTRETARDPWIDDNVLLTLEELEELATTYLRRPFAARTARPKLLVAR